MSYIRPFEPTHTLAGTEVQATGWQAAGSDMVEYVTRDGGYWESRWCQATDLEPLPRVETVALHQLDNSPGAREHRDNERYASYAALARSEGQAFADETFSAMGAYLVDIAAWRGRYVDELTDVARAWVAVDTEIGTAVITYPSVKDAQDAYEWGKSHGLSLMIHTHMEDSDCGNFCHHSKSTEYDRMNNA